MSIASLFNKRVTIRRMSSLGGFKKAFQATATVDAHVQPLGLNEKEGIPAVDTKDYIMWCDVTDDIKKGDKVSVSYENLSSGRTTFVDYLVKSVEVRDYPGVAEHLEVQLEKLAE